MLLKQAFFATVALIPMASGAFFDGFDGTELAPHWSVMSAGAWTYAVGGGILDVTSITGVSGAGVTVMTANVGAMDDFDMLAVLGWDMTPGQEMSVFLENRSATDERTTLAELTFYHPPGSFTGSLIMASAGNSEIGTAGAPLSGFWPFIIGRTAGVIQVTFRGERLIEEKDSLLPVTNISLRFRAHGFTGLMADSVQIVPEPSALLYLSAWLLALALRTKRLRLFRHDD